MQKFIFRISILTFSIAIIGTILFLTIFSHFFSIVFPILLIFYVILSFAIQFLSIKMAKLRPAVFTRFFMLATVCKLLICSTFIMLILFFNRQIAIPFSIFALILYFVFTFFEISETLKMFKK